LKNTAAVLRATTRRSDVVCRLDGEEFVIICPDSTVEAAASGAERLRKAVESSIIDVAGFGRAVTVSIGVAARTASTEDPDALLKAADEALYEAKRSGRNRIRAALGTPPQEDPALISCAS
jgi:two-component system cell cycle response regulator